jgi:hypothetical protein
MVGAGNPATQRKGWMKTPKTLGVRRTRGRLDGVTRGLSLSPVHLTPSTPYLFFADLGVAVGADPV